MANYTDVNAVWPDPVPVPSGPEAIAGARKLTRLALTLGPPNGIRRVPPKKFKLTSGNRYTWANAGTFMVNPDHQSLSFGGWSAMVHDIAHWAARKLYREGHGPHECFIEHTLAKHVVDSGWLDGKLKRPEKPREPVQCVRRRRVLERIAAWERKRRRAETALKKLRRQARYYEMAEQRLSA
jgi:hypothetical protein